MRTFLSFLDGGIRDRQRHYGPAALVWRDGQASAAHDFEPLTNVVQREMPFAVVGGVEAPVVVGYDDLAAGSRFSRLDGNAKRSGIGISAVLDGILHDGLQGQRRDTERGIPLLAFGHPPPLGEGSKSLPCRERSEAVGNVYSSFPSPSGGGCRRSGRRGRTSDFQSPCAKSQAPYSE